MFNKPINEAVMICLVLLEISYDAESRNICITVQACVTWKLLNDKNTQKSKSDLLNGNKNFPGDWN